MVPGESEVWDFSASPAAPVASQYVQQGALSTQASTSTLGTKSSAQLLGTGTGAGALGIVGPIVSIT